MDIKKLKAKARPLPAFVRIGKNGITDSQISEIKKFLENKKLVKIKLLSSFASGKNKKQIALDLQKQTDSELIEQIGGTIVLYKK